MTCRQQKKWARRPLPSRSGQAGQRYHRPTRPALQAEGVAGSWRSCPPPCPRARACQSGTSQKG